jgi:hypothetical protein
MKRSRSSGADRRLDPWELPRPDRALTCLLTPLPDGKPLSLALVHCLSEEIPDIRFTLDPSRHADAVWVCGLRRARRPLPAQAARALTGRPDRRHRPRSR